MLRFLLTTILLIILCSCASTPPPTAGRIIPARHAVAQAYAVGAQDLARDDYGRAKAKLEKGYRLNREGEPEKADLVLKQAIFFASRAIERSREARKFEPARTESEREPSASENPAGSEVFEIRILGSEEKTGKEKPIEPVEAAVPESREQPPKQPETAPEPDPPRPEEYVVKEGETLWTIAARRIIYHDALLWPLIYKANRDQIKDPRQIFPEQVLAIPRDSTEKDTEEAREKARRSQIFPVEILMRQNADSLK